MGIETQTPPPYPSLDAGMVQAPLVYVPGTSVTDSKSRINEIKRDIFSHATPFITRLGIDSAASNKQVGGTHYKTMEIEPWDVVDTWPLEQRIGFYRGGCLKYLMRMGTKDESAQEIAKGKHYIEKLLEVLKEASQTT